MIYLAPTLVAAHRRLPNLRTLLLLNVYLGWTGLIWLICVQAAVEPQPVTARTRRPQGVEPPQPLPEQRQ